MSLTPRHKRALALLKKQAVSREVLDREVGCSNGPALIAELRKMGFSFPCKMMPGLDRDGKKVRYGVYSAESSDRLKIAALGAEE